MNRHVNLPFTEDGKKFNMTKEMFEKCKVVYQKIPSNNDEIDDNTNDGYMFKSLYNPHIDYSDDCIIVPFQSVFAGTDTWYKEDIFCNLCGSSKDNPEGTTWKKLCESNNIGWYCHAETNAFYRTSTGKEVIEEGCQSINENKHFKCNSVIVGGHVLKGEIKPRYIEPDEKTDIYIVPICSHHNVLKVDDGDNKGTGTGFYMKLGVDKSEVIKIDKFVPKKRIRELNDKTE